MLKQKITKAACAITSKQTETISCASFNFCESLEIHKFHKIKRLVITSRYTVGCLYFKITTDLECSIAYPLLNFITYIYKR